MEPFFWLFAIQYFFMTNSLNAFGYFAPSIVASLGFKGYNAQLLTVPPNVFALFIIIGNCLHSDRTKERSKHVIGGLAFVATGYLLLAVVTNWRVRYFAVFIIACTNAAVLPFVAVSELSSIITRRNWLLTFYLAPNGHRPRLNRNGPGYWRHDRHCKHWRYLCSLPVPQQHLSHVRYGQLDSLCLPRRGSLYDWIRLVRLWQPQRLPNWNGR